MASSAPSRTGLPPGCRASGRRRASRGGWWLVLFALVGRLALGGAGVPADGMAWPPAASAVLGVLCDAATPGGGATDGFVTGAPHRHGPHRLAADGAVLALPGQDLPDAILPVPMVLAGGLPGPSRGGWMRPLSRGPPRVTRTAAHPRGPPILS
ncbi:hypothetical protein AAC691_18910 [Nguyenibacter vanlangensis]|uniref:Secreted protein n=1 Tax=Nguyenibacter vanlangensis TaxID=1216886 RepID=A0ABZ3D3K8_9PROT